MLQQAEADADKPTKAEAMEESERVLAEQRRNMELIAQCVAAPSFNPYATAVCCAVPWLQAVGGNSFCLGSRARWQWQDMRLPWQGLWFPYGRCHTGCSGSPLQCPRYVTIPNRQTPDLHGAIGVRRERQRLRAAQGLDKGDMSSEVLARCALRAGVAADLLCDKAGDGFAIRGETLWQMGLLGVLSRYAKMASSVQCMCTPIPCLYLDSAIGLALEGMCQNTCPSGTAKLGSARLWGVAENQLTVQGLLRRLR